MLVHETVQLSRASELELFSLINTKIIQTPGVHRRPKAKLHPSGGVFGMKLSKMSLGVFIHSDNLVFSIISMQDKASFNSRILRGSAYKQLRYKNDEGFARMAGGIIPSTSCISMCHIV